MGFHFSMDRKDLLAAMGAQQNIASKGGTMVILSNVLVDVNEASVTFTGTNLEVGLKQEVPAEVTATGSLTLPAKKLFELARESASATVTFVEKENRWVEITAGSSLYKLAGMEGDEFPEFPAYDESSLVEMSSEVLIDLLEKIIFSIATDKENIYSLTAALIKKEIQDGKECLTAVSSDGHRLSIMTRELGDAIKDLHLNPVTLIPRNGVLEIKKFCEKNETVLLGFEKKQAVLKSDTGLLIIRLMEGEFPDYKVILDVIPRDFFIEIDRLSFLESLKRINLFADEDFHAIKIHIGNNLIELNSQNADYGSARDELPIDYTGEELELGFNCRYFIEALQIMSGPMIKVYISSDESPCLITSDDDPGLLCIIMPMKL